MDQITVLIIAPTRMEAVAALCPRGVEPGICAASILATSCGATVPRFSGCTGWDSETNALVQKPDPDCTYFADPLAVVMAYAVIPKECVGQGVICTGI